MKARTDSKWSVGRSRKFFSPRQRRDSRSRESRNRRVAWHWHDMTFWHAEAPRMKVGDTVINVACGCRNELLYSTVPCTCTFWKFEPFEVDALLTVLFGSVQSLFDCLSAALLYAALYGACSCFFACRFWQVYKQKSTALAYFYRAWNCLCFTRRCS